MTRQAARIPSAAVLLFLGACTRQFDIGVFPVAPGDELDASGSDSAALAEGASIDGGAQESGRGGDGWGDQGADRPISGDGTGGDAGGGADDVAAMDVARGNEGVAVSTAALSFMAWSGQSAPPEAAQLWVTGDTSYATSIRYGVGAAGWLDAKGQAVPGALSIVPTTTNLAPGTYDAMVVLTPTAGAAAVEIAVTYVLSASSSASNPTSVAFDAAGEPAPTPASLERQVATVSTGVPLAWTATSSAPWLSVTAQGTTGTRATLSLLPTQLMSLPAGEHTAAVTFTYGGPYVPSATRALPVTLTLAGPMVNFVAPYVALADTSAEVILRGTGFHPAAGLTVMFGASPALMHVVVSDTEIRATHPPLSVGEYPVRVVDGAGLGRTRARLVVKAPAALTYAAVPTSAPDIYGAFASSQSRTFHDPERVAVYAALHLLNLSGSDGGYRLQRHRLVGDRWISDTLLDDTAAVDIALTPDGRELVALSPSALYHIDLDRWQVSSRLDQQAAFGSYQAIVDDFRLIVMSNDGKAIVRRGNRLLRYDVLTRTFGELVLPVPETVPKPRLPEVDRFYATASGDGSRILLTMCFANDLADRVCSSLPVYHFDTTLSQFVKVQPALGATYVLAYNRTGTRALIEGYLYNERFEPQGFSQDLDLGAVLSADGTRGYGYTMRDRPQPPGGWLRVFDLTSRTAQGGFTQVGPTMDITDDPAGWNLALSLDGRTAFLSGSRRLIVQPLP